MLSLGGIIYLIARAVPRVSDEELKKNPSLIPSHGFMMFLEQVDEKFKIIFEKWLRRTRIWVLKFDNFVAEKLKKFRKETPKETGFAVEEKKQVEDTKTEV